MTFGFDSPYLDEAESWAAATAAYEAGLKIARAEWQPDARTALTELTDYPPAHLDEAGRWQIYYWSPNRVSGLRLRLDATDLTVIEREEWGGYYRAEAIRIGTELLGPHGFEFAPDVSQNGPEVLGFVFRRPQNDKPGWFEFVDIQVSTTVMLTPPPRRLTANLVRNMGDRPTFGANGGWTARLGAVLPQPDPDKWWPFQDVAQYSAVLHEVMRLTIDWINGLTIN